MALLAHQVLRRVALWSTLAVLGATALAYTYAYRLARDNALERLTRHAELQGRLEERAFHDAAAHLDLMRAEFLRRYKDASIDYAGRFDAMYRSGPDGAVRLGPEYFRGTRTGDGRYLIHTTGWLGAGVPTGEDLRRRLVIATELVAELGPAWGEPFANLHMSLPDNAMVLYWPGTPWGLNARPGLDITQGAVVAATLPANNPGRQLVWSGLYYDLTAKQWTVTVQLPVDDEDGRHLANPSHDVLLGEILDRLQTSRFPGASTLLVSADGHLIAGPEQMDPRDQARGVLHVDALEDPLPARIHRLAEQHVREGHPAHVMRDEPSGAYVVFSRIAGPDWRLATIYPETLIASAAHRGAMIMLALGIGLQLILLAVVGGVLGKRISQPIHRLRESAGRIARGDEPEAAVAALPLDQDNEIGGLARSFRELAEKVDERRHQLEGTVAERTRELAEANALLERLTRTDPLTALPNRRAFDDDLAEALASTDPLKAVALGMLDVDFFKPYNDTLGHEAGDEALRRVASVLAAQTRRDVRTYRYGGEEFAVLFTAIAVPHAERILRRILGDIAGLAVAHPSSPHGVVTVSAGLAKVYGDVVDAASLIRAADRQLYAAKASGRNRLATG